MISAFARRGCVFLLFLLVVAATIPIAWADAPFIPDYIVNGLQTYPQSGYEAAVRVWLKGSPFENATAMASRIAFFKNIEMLYGKFVSHEVVTTRKTAISHMAYIRMNYQKTSAYIRFISILRDDRWVLSNIHLDRHQKHASAATVRYLAMAKPLGENR